MSTPRTRLVLLIAIAAVTICGTSYAQTLIGSSGAGWQSWTVIPISSTQPDLNDNGAPWWDLQWNAAGAYGTSSTADKNPGFCITATGDCVGFGSQGLAPGALPFWGMSYDSAGDSGGARDNTVYFRSNGSRLRATLYLNATAVANEVNDFGWFETNSTGSMVGTRHLLFSGTGNNKDQIPTATGTSVNFTPTRYFGYYYSDVSEPACPHGTDQPCADPAAPLHGCYAYSLFNLNDARCTETGGNQGDHDFVVFSSNPTSFHPTYWIAGEDPSDCANQDGDCNLTVVKVTAAPSN